MSQTDRRGVKFVTLLAVLWSVASATANICAVVNGITRQPVTGAVDGFSYDFFTDFRKWISSQTCDASSSQVQWTSDWIDNNDIAYSSNGVTGMNAKVQYSISGSTSGDPFNVVGTVTVQLTLIKGSSSNPAVATFGFDVRGVTTDLAGHFPPIWQGSLKTTASSGLGVFDDDLFDGAGAFVVSDVSAGSMPSSTDMKEAENIARLVGDVNQRFRNFEPVPTALSGDMTARLAFPGTNIIQTVTTDDIHKNGTSGFVASAHGECRGTDCGADAQRALKLLVGADTVCQSPSLMADSLYGSVRATVGIENGKNVYVVGVRSTIQGVFACSSGFIGISLVSFADPHDAEENNFFSLRLFKNDTRAAIAQVKAIGMEVHGRRYGYVTRDGSTIMTPVETDMFGYGRGGAFVDDVVISDSVVSSFQTAVSSIAKLLSGNYPSVNDVFTSLCDPSASAEIAQRYFAQVAHPTSYGLWSFWAEQFNGFAVARDEVDNKLILEINSHIHSQFKFESSDASVTSINSVLSTVNSKVKEACGSACSSITAVPTLTAESITDSKMDIAVSATVSIPTMSLSIDAVKSNAAMKQIQLIRRQNPFNGPEDVHMEFVSRITASLGSQASTLDQVTVIYSSVLGTAAMSKGFLTSAVSGVIGPVGMGVNGQVFFNSDISSSLLPAFATNLATISNTVSQKEGMTLQSLVQVSDHVGAPTLSEFLKSVAYALPTTGGNTVFSYFDTVRNLIEDTLIAAGVIPMLSLSFSQSDNVISADLAFVSVRRIGFEASGAYWAKNVPVSRTMLTLPLSTHVSFAFGSASTVSSYQIQGYSHAQGFSLPVREGMRVGLATAGFAETVINVPTLAYLTVSFNGKMERGSTFSGVFSGNMTVTDPDTPLEQLFSFSMNEDNPGGYGQQADPSATLAALSNNFVFPSLIAQHQLKDNLAPFNRPIVDIIDFDSSWKERTTWVFSSEAYPYVYVNSVSFPFSGFTETVNISVNSAYDYTNCVFNIPSATSIDDLVNSMSQAVASCGDLSTFVRVDYTAGKTTDYSLVMVPIYAGSVYDFVISAPNTSQSIMQSQSWSASRVTPDHLSWNDLYNGVYLALLKPTPSYSYAEPRFTTVKVADAHLVDESRAKFYPSEVSGVFFDAAVKYHNPPRRIPIEPDFPSEGNNISVNVASSNATIQGDVSMSVTFGMALWCSLGSGILPFFTSFTSDNGNRFDQVVVPASPDNTFSISATAEKRLASAVSSVPELVTISQKFTLTPGKLLLNALVEEMHGQLSGIGAQMITVENHTDATFTQDVQALVQFKPYNPDSDTLYVPLEFSVLPNNLGAFGSASSIAQVKAVTSCPLAKDFKLDINVQSSPNLDDGDANGFGLGDSIDCSGTLGVSEISKCAAQMSVNHAFSVSNVKSLTLLGDIFNAIPDSEHFSDWFKNVANLSTTLAVSNLTFNVASNTMSDLASESVILDQVVSVPFNELKNASESLYSVNIPSTKPTGRALASLMTTNRQTFCSGLKQSFDKVTAFAESDEMRQTLPFTNRYMSPIFSRLINERLEDVMNSVCDVTNERVSTLSGFCNEFANKFGFSICGNATLSDDGLDIPLLMQPETAMAPAAFQFDSRRIISKATFSSAIGNSGDLVLDADVSARVGLKLAFLQRNETSEGPEYYSEAELDAKTTVFTSRASLDSSPRVRTLLGTTVVTFDSQALDLDVTIKGGISDNSDDIEVDLDGSARLDAHTANEDSSYYCHVTADVPVVRHYFYPPENAWEDTVTFSDNCLQGDFVTGVESSFDNMTLAHYFEQDPNNFFKQFSNGLLKDLFNDILDYITNKAIAYIGKSIQNLCSKAFDKIVGPEVSAKMADEITDMIAKVIHSGEHPDPSDLERVVLTFFTGILNKIFGPYLKSEIPTPEPGDVITWEFRFGNVSTKQLNTLDWSCGDHGIADFEVKSENTLTMSWAVSFDVVWNKTAGVSITWPVSPAMNGHISLDGSGLDISGSLLFLTADLNGAASLSGDLSANPAQRDINFVVDAELDTTGKLGLVNKIRQETRGDKENALGALPYVSAGVKASWAFNWGTQNPRPTMPHSFQFTEPQLCLGSLITEFMQQVCREVNRVIEPLDPIFGPDGILQKPIPGLSKIFGSHTNVLTILEWTCEMFSSSSCNINTVRKLVEVLNDIAADIGKIKEFMNYMQSPEGCMDFSYIYRTFNISWDKDQPTPDDPDSPTNGIIPMTPTEKFYDSVPSYEQQPLRDIMAKWSPSNSAVIRSDCVNCTEADAVIVNDGDNKFGFKLDILENFPQKLITILLGGNVALFSVSFPQASFSYSVTWTIPVWDVPYVAVNIHAGASVSFQPPSVALMSNAIIDTVKTGNPSHLFRNLAVSTTTAFASGTFEVDGGAEGGIHIIIAKVTVNFDVTVKFIVEARVANFNGDDWATFDTIFMQVKKYGFNGAIQFSLQLRGGFKLYLQGCVNVLFFKKCWTIVSWSWDTTLWSWEPKNDLITSVASASGTVDPNSFDFYYPTYGTPRLLPVGDPVLRTYVITNTGVMFMPDNIQEGNAALTRNIDASIGISFGYSMPCTTEYNIMIDGDITRPSMSLPTSCDKLHIIIKQRGYRSVDQYNITGTSITPLARSPISFGTAASLSLEDPVYGIKYILSGSPSFPLSIDTDYSSTINFTGSGSNYKGPVTITGAVETIFVAMSCSNLNISNTSITCDSFVATIPETVHVIHVDAVNPEPQPHPHPEPRPEPIPINITIDVVPEDRSVEVVGASPLVSVKVPDMKNMSGIVSIVGNTADDNYIHVDMDTPADRDIVATAYPSQLAYNDSDSADTHVIRHANVNIRSYSMKAAAGRKSTMRVVSPIAYESVTVAMIGAKDSVLRNELEGCDRRSMVNVSMSDEGTQTLVLGANGRLDSVQCSLRVFTENMKNDKNSIREIIVNATLDERPLNWEFSDGEFSVSNSLDSSDVFHVFTDGLDHVTVHFSKMNGNKLTFNKNDNDGMEYVFVFPEESSSITNDYSLVQISQTHSPILMQGPVMNVILGDPDGSVTPLSMIGAVVVAPSGSNIIMNSAGSLNATHLAISENCVFEQEAAPVSKPSDWFIQSVKDLGIDFNEGCNVLVPKVSNNPNAGFSTTFDITAGVGDDSLDAMNPAVHVVANMGDGDDSVNWFSPESTSRLFLQMGAGADTFSVQSAGPVNVDFGDDDEPDYLTVVCKDVSPSIIQTSVFPIGVKSKDARLEISSWDSYDTIEIARFSLNAPEERESAVVACDVLGAKIIYQQNDNTDYHVTMCTNKSVLSFTTAYQGFDRAEDTSVEIALETYDNDCTVNVDGAAKTNGALLVGVNSNAQVVPGILNLTTGSAVFGNTRVSLKDVDHIGISIPEAFADNGTLIISGAPAVQDVFVNLPTWDTVISKDVKDITIVSTYGDVVVRDFDTNYKGVIVSLNHKESSTQVDIMSSTMKEFTMTNGCIESNDKKTLSKWVLAQTKEAGFDLPAEHKCSALFKGVRYLVLDDTKTCKTVTMSGLGWDTVRSVWLSESVEKLVLESVNTETKDSLWTGASMTDNDIMISKMNKDAFHVQTRGSKVDVHVASSVFAPKSTFVVNCTDSSYHHHWNIALDKSSNTDDISAYAHSYYTDVNFTSNGATCSGRINNRVFASMDSAPSVYLVPGIGASVLVETFGTKDASKVERTVNLSSSDGYNRLRFHSFDRSSEELQVRWDSAITGDLTVHVSDRSENVIAIDPTITSEHPLHLSASAHSALSFANLTNYTIAFEGVDPAHFDVVTKSFDLLGGKSNTTSNTFCFSPCDMCSQATWDQIRLMGQPCSIETAETSKCSQSAHIRVSQESIPALMSVSCNKAHWDPTNVAAGECSIAFNENGAGGEFTNLIPGVCKVLAAIVAIAAAVATVIGASVLASRLIFALGKTELPGINRWWITNMMRDFFNDQFSWAAVVLTACLGGVSNYDISNWGGPVDGLVLETKGIVFDWMNFCKSSFPPVVAAFWVLALICVALRLATAIGASRDTLKWRRALYVLDPVHALVSSLTMLMLPLAGYAVAVLMQLNVLSAVTTLVAAICVIASAPVGVFKAATVMRVIASFTAITVPFIMSIVAGAGASRGLVIGLLIVSAILLPVCNTFVLWKSFFAGADTRTKAWKHSLFWTFGLRAASMIFGVIFLSTLLFNLSATASGFAYAFWMLWVVLPPLQLIPLLAGTTSSNIVPRDYRASNLYGPINSGETTPLRSGLVSPGASLSSISNLPGSGRNMVDVAAA